MPKLDNRLRAKLRELGLPYHQLARQVGVSSTMMRRIVYAKADPRLEVALKIAVVLECPFAELFSVEGAACAGEPGRRG